MYPVHKQTENVTVARFAISRIFSFSAGLATNSYFYRRFPVRLRFTYG